MQAMRAIEHEDLVRGDAMALDELRNLADVRRVHGREVVAVVDVEASLRKPQHLGKEIEVRPALVQVVLAGAKVVQARRHAALRRRAALAYRILCQRRVDAGVHVRIDHAGKSESVHAVINSRRVGAEVRRNARELLAADRDIGLARRALAGAHDAHILDEEVVRHRRRRFTPKRARLASAFPDARAGRRLARFAGGTPAPAPRQASRRSCGCRCGRHRGPL